MPTRRPVRRRPLKRVTYILIAIAALSLSIETIAQDPLSKTLAFTHVGVIDVSPGRVLADTTVVVTGNRIIAIGKTGTVNVPPRSAASGSGESHLIAWALGRLFIDQSSYAVLE